MKIHFISDTHTRHRQVTLTGGDVLVHCGDFTNTGKPKDVLEFFNWFAKQKYSRKILVAGNHDLSAQFADIFHTVWLETVRDFKYEITYLENSETVVEGIKFYGTPWVPMFHNWAFMAEEKVLEWIYDSIPDDTDILITHGPPKFILDLNQDGHYCGSQALSDKISKLNIKINAFGHIHHSYGTFKLPNGPMFINAALCNDRHEVINSPIEVIYEQGKVVER